jgi:WD40 repeat protein/serine/threonine protein kinase
MAIEGINEENIFRNAIQYENRDEQATYVKRACGSDTELCEAVEALLQHHNASSILDAPAVEAGLLNETTPVTEGLGTRIGRYKLLEKIGEGGMAVVYMAEQEKPIHRRVALKIIKLGMDTKSVIARFEAERQALAIMDHPNIAKVLDAGATESGRPYFVMDLVPGLSITEYCDKNRLNIDERLKLFILICNAVQHAHQKGIIHRDIKPSNIIVTMHDGEPVPKVIDFGIAKATNQRLTEKTLFTRHAQIIGTPAYMSPEQAELSDWDIDTRTDIYSLGILLYELLTGTTPFGKEQLREAGYLQMQKIICEQQPTKPSTKLSTLGEALADVAQWHSCSPELMPKLVRGDLDWIAMKTLEKDRTRRYDTASTLAMDVQRHLNCEPVQAAAPSISYKLRKFATRHRVFVTAGSFVAAALLVVAVISTMYAREVAVHARESEDARQEITGLLAGSYVDRAQALCEQGEVGRGMLWLADSLKIAPEGSSDLDRAIRTSLAAWNGQLHSLRAVAQYPDQITALIFSPDGTRILAACLDGTARICDSATGEPIGRSLRHGNGIVAAAISPNGNCIATGDGDGLVRLWDGVTLEPVGEPIQHDKGLVMAFSPDSSRLMTGGAEGAVRLWDAATGESLGKVFQYESESRRHVLAVAFCPEGLRAVLRTDTDWFGRFCQMFDVERGEPIGPPVEGSTFTATISPDGTRFATGSRIWDAATGEPAIGPISRGGSIYALAFSPDGSRIVSGGMTRMALLYDALTGEHIGGPLRQRDTVRAVAFNPEGTRLVTGNEDGVVRIWDLVQRRYVGEPVKHEDKILAAAYGPHSLRILTGVDGAIQIRDAATGSPIGKPFSHRAQFHRVVFSPDDTRFVTQRANFWRLQLWDTVTGEKIGKPFHVEPHCVAFSPDGSRLLTGGEDNIARLWDAATLKSLGELHQHRKTVSDVAFSPDGSRFLTGSFDGTAQLWDAAKLVPIGKPLIHQSEVKGLAFSPDGRKILIGFADGTVRLYDAATLKPIGTPLQHMKIVCAVDFSPDGSQLLACSIDRTARLWDAATLKPIGPPLEHGGRWPRASFSPDGSQILLADGRGAAQVWRVPPGPLAGECERIVCWVQVVTGMELDSTGGINVLDAPTWQNRRLRLQKLGGPPVSSLPQFSHRNEEKFLQLENEEPKELGPGGLVCSLAPRAPQYVGHFDGQKREIFGTVSSTEEGR